MVFGIVEIVIAIAAWILAVHKQAARRAAVIMSAGSLLVLISRGQEWGRYPMALGFTLNLIAGVMILLVFLPLGIVADKVMARSPHTHGRVAGIYVFALGSFIAIMTILFTDIYLFPTVVNILFVLIVFLGLTAGLPGVSKNLWAWNARLFILGVALVSSYVYVHLPYKRLVQIDQAAQWVSGAKSGEIAPPTIAQIQSGEFSFYSKLKSNTPIYRYRQDEEGVVRLYPDGGSGIDPTTGNPMPLVTPKIIRIYKQQQVRREAKAKEAAEATLKAQQDVLATEQKRQQEASAKLQEEEKKKTAEAQAEITKIKEEKPVEKEPETTVRTTIADLSVTAQFTVNKELRTDQLARGNSIQGYLAEDLDYAGYTFPAVKTRMLLSVITSIPDTGQEEAEIILLPTALEAPGRTQIIRFVAEWITLTAQGQSGSEVRIPKNLKIKKAGRNIKVPANYPLQLRLKAGPS